MKPPTGMIDASMAALNRSRELYSSFGLSHLEMSRMRSDHVEERVSEMLARNMSPLIMEIASRAEAIERSQEAYEPHSQATLFRARAVIMTPEDYSTLCELLRFLMQNDNDEDEHHHD